MFYVGVNLRLFSPLYTKTITLYSIGGNFVREFNIRFFSFRDVQDFVVLATEQSFPIVVGNDRYRVNGTSFMGMFSLDYSQPLKVTVSCTEAEFQDFRQKAERFLAK